MTRQLDADRSQAPGSQAEVQRIKGPPKEKITLKIELDAADQLEKPLQNPQAVIMGIYPQLSALEMMLYPKSLMGNNENCSGKCWGNRDSST